MEDADDLIDIRFYRYVCQVFYEAPCYVGDWEGRRLGESFEFLLSRCRHVISCHFAFDALVVFNVFYDL